MHEMYYSYIRVRVYIYICTSAFFSLPVAGLFSCSRLRSTQRARPNTTAQVWALAEVRGTCSGFKVAKIGKHPGGGIPRTYSHPGPCKPTYRLKKCPPGCACRSQFCWRLALCPSRACARVLVLALALECPSCSCSSALKLVRARASYVGRSKPYRFSFFGFLLFVPSAAFVK